MHFEFDDTALEQYLIYYTEPLFFLLISNDTNSNTFNYDISINVASQNGCIEIIKYLHETYQYNIEAKDEYECTSIINASMNGHLEIIKYLYETWHANVEAKDNEGNSLDYYANNNWYAGFAQLLHEACRNY